jgi:hypothetical protein
MKQAKEAGKGLFFYLFLKLKFSDNVCILYIYYSGKFYGYSKLSSSENHKDLFHVM